MEFGNILKVDVEALDALEKEKRVECIDDAIHRLKFERRVTLLTDKQRDAMMDESLSDAQREKLDKCKTEEDRYRVCQEFARLTYFRRLAWAAYLNGETKDAPVPAE